MPKFTKIDEGKFAKLGREYRYVVEIADEKHIKADQKIRLRIVDEKPIIRKIRTRYDPEIKLFGDKKATMNLSLGYNMKELKNTIMYLFLTLTGPFILTGAMFGLIQINKIPSHILPKWLLWILIPSLAVLMTLFFKLYYKMNMQTFAQYLKARDLKKTLEKKGFKQE